MWDLVKVNAGNVNVVNEYLQKGYEPFAVSVDKYDTETIWLKKEVDEIHSKQDPKQRTSRRAAKTAKG